MAQRSQIIGINDISTRVEADCMGRSRCGRDHRTPIAPGKEGRGEIKTDTIFVETMPWSGFIVLSTWRLCSAGDGRQSKLGSVSTVPLSSLMITSSALLVSETSVVNHDLHIKLTLVV